MATARLDIPVKDELTGAGARVVDAVRQVAHVAHEAKAFTSLASDAVEDGVHAAKRAVTRGARTLEDLRDTAGYRIKRAPFAALGLAFGAGVLLAAVGYGVVRAARSCGKQGEV